MKKIKTQKRASFIACGAIVMVLIGLAFYVPSSDALVVTRRPVSPWIANAAPPPQRENINAQLTERLQKLCAQVDGTISVAVIHVESGRTAVIQDTTPMPLHSVYKLPLAISVLKEAAAHRLRLDQKVLITPAKVAPGAKANTDLGDKPVERTVAELLELSLVRSDNIASVELVQLIGGPQVVTQRMRSLGFQNIDLHSYPFTGTASDLARLLAQLQQGKMLQSPQLTLLLDMMRRATTGLRRLRGALPPGTPVADKTGTGADGQATNDVGLITLPEGRGHLAMAVLLSGSKLTVEAQEKFIAELARAAYDAHLAEPHREVK